MEGDKWNGERGKKHRKKSERDHAAEMERYVHEFKAGCACGKRQCCTQKFYPPGGLAGADFV